MRGENANQGDAARTHGAQRPLLEALEARQLLSATLHQGVLTVRGTAGDDAISVSVDPQHGNRYLADINGHMTRFDKEMVKMIHVFGGRGDDSINVSQRFGRITAKMTVDGGKGHNVITGYTAAKRALARAAGVFALGGQILAGSGDTTANGPLPASKSAPVMAAAQAGTGATSTMRVALGDPITDAQGNPLTAGEISNVVNPPLGGTDEGNSGSTQPPGSQSGTFRVYDATHFLDAPDFSKFGVTSVYLTGNEFWSGTWPNFDESHPDEAATRALARKVAALGQILVIDIEHWRTDIRTAPDAEVQSSIDKLSQIVAWIRDERPQVKLGFYSLFPSVGFFAMPSKVYPGWDSSPAYLAWQAANDRLKPLADLVDFIVPSLYTFTEDRGRWQIYAEATIREARRYGKPVLPFLWTDYDMNGPQYNTAIPSDFWKLELDTCRQIADGVVIWGGWNVPRDGGCSRREWDGAAPWWQLTTQFVQSLSDH